MDGVVAVELGLLERQQIVLLDEDADAGPEVRKGRLADENVVELLDQKRAIDAGSDPRQAPFR